MKMEQFKKPLSIGQVSELADVTIQTIRFYERRGLLKEITRLPSGYRRYTDNDISIINFIKRSQELGFSLSEIEELLWLQSDNAANRKGVRSLAKAKIKDIENRINNLKTIERNLARLVDSCTRVKSTGKCSILDALKSNKTKGKPK